MATRTLLDMVQTILESLGETQVTTIDETMASLQVAQIVRDTYYDGQANRNWPDKRELTQFQPYGVDKPTHLIIPSDVKQVDELVYNKRTTSDTNDKYDKVKYVSPRNFLDYVNARNSSDADTQTVTDVGGVSLFIKNDVAPSYWTSFDQGHIVLDSYDGTVDTTLQASKQQVWVVKDSGTFSLTDDFVPDIPEEAFPWLLAESKSTAFVEISQTVNEKAEQRSRKQQQWLSRKSRKAGQGRGLASFGRNTRK